jgi:CheY-like chemotaxis protein
MASIRRMTVVYAPAGDSSATAAVGPMSCPARHNGVMRVLVAEDHVALAGQIAEGLRDAGLAVDVADDGAAALTQAGLTAYDVIVLDRDLPVVHGDQVCRTLAGGSARILMLTAAAGVDDRARVLSWCSSPGASLWSMSCSCSAAAGRAGAAVVRRRRLRKRFSAAAVAHPRWPPFLPSAASSLAGAGGETVPKPLVRGWPR